jgi:hypothetical protein
MNRMLIALGMAVAAAGPTLASESDVMVPVHQFVDS